MEQSKDRVLAYCVAKTMDREEMLMVSGGSVHWTHYVTANLSAASLRGVDVVDDVRVDW